MAKIHWTPIICSSTPAWQHHHSSHCVTSQASETKMQSFFFSQMLEHNARIPHGADHAGQEFMLGQENKKLHVFSTQNSLCSRQIYHRKTSRLTGRDLIKSFTQQESISFYSSGWRQGFLSSFSSLLAAIFHGDEGWHNMKWSRSGSSGNAA